MLAGVGEPVNREPEKCEGWSWFNWEEALPEPLFTSLDLARARGVDPFSTSAVVSDDEPLPPYCCVILREASGAWLVEARSETAAVAAGALTCFGGKREPGEEPSSCVLRECREELGWAPTDAVRAVDLYVDGELIAFFYSAAAPERDAELVCEEGRRVNGCSIELCRRTEVGSDVLTKSATSQAVWMEDLDAAKAEGMPLSPWHCCVLRALQAGDRRADFTTSS